MGKCIRNFFLNLIENDFIYVLFIIFYIINIYSIFLPNYESGGIAYPTTFVGILLFMLYIYKRFNPYYGDLICKISMIICALTAKGLFFILGIFCCLGAWNFIHSIIVVYILMTVLLLIFSAYNNKNKIKRTSTIERIGAIIYKPSYKNMLSIIFFLCLIYMLFHKNGDVIQQIIIYLMPFIYIFAIKYMIKISYLHKKKKVLITGLHYSVLLIAISGAILTKTMQILFDSVFTQYNHDTMITFCFILLTLLICLIKFPNK